MTSSDLVKATVRLRHALTAHIAIRLAPLKPTQPTMKFSALAVAAVVAGASVVAADYQPNPALRALAEPNVAAPNAAAAPAAGAPENKDGKKKEQWWGGWGPGMGWGGGWGGPWGGWGGGWGGMGGWGGGWW